MISKQAKILVLGGGAAGISAAYYLNRQGYRRVRVVERNGRLGGKCHTVTRGGRSFDLGANYLTSSYKEILALARKYGAKTYREGDSQVYRKSDRQLLSVAAATRGEQSKRAMLDHARRYLSLRLKLNDYLAPRAPGFLEASRHPDLLVSMDTWLERNDLAALKPIFRIPITLMGYGELNVIPAAYGLTYMNVPTFTNLVVSSLNVPVLDRWPRRFVHGTERFLERVAAEVDLERGVEVTRIERGAGGIEVQLTTSETDLMADRRQPRAAERFDYLVVATPYLAHDGEATSTDGPAPSPDAPPPARPTGIAGQVMNRYLDLTADERRLFSEISFIPFSVATFDTRGLERIAAVTFIQYADGERKPGLPYGITRQFADSDFVSVYTRLADDGADRLWDERGQWGEREAVLAADIELMRELGATAIGPDDNQKHEHFHLWPYFPHVKVERMAGAEGQPPFYQELEGLQGQNRTFYAGGLFAFELIETIFGYSKDLIARHFTGARA